jgi:hypothetical protein
MHHTPSKGDVGGTEGAEALGGVRPNSLGSAKLPLSSTYA